MNTPSPKPWRSLADAPIRPACASCAYFQPHSHLDRLRKGQGICRRLPPAMSPDYRYGGPGVLPNDWCGAYALSPHTD